MIKQLLLAANKRKMERLKGFFKEEPNRFDLNLPLRFALGRGVTIDPTPFILAGNDILVDQPKGEGKVVAIGQIDIDLGGEFKIYRFYLQYLDSKDSIIQLVQDKTSKVIVEIMYLQTMDEVTPGDIDDWDVWLNKETGLLGYKDFTTQNGVEYTRSLPEHGGDKVNPIEMEEFLSIDPYGPNDMIVNHEVVYYGRTVNSETSEFCIVSKEDDNGGDYIRILSGIPLEQSFISVL
jgi:hypothetical protein